MPSEIRFLYGPFPLNDQFLPLFGKAIPPYSLFPVFYQAKSRSFGTKVSSFRAKAKKLKESDFIQFSDCAHSLTPLLSTELCGELIE